MMRRATAARFTPACFAILVLGMATIAAASAGAQPLDLAHGGPIAITAADGIEWRQAEQQVVARGEARAVRDNVTVTADTLTAWYRPKAGANGKTPPASRPGGDAGILDNPDTGGNEIYRVEALGHVRIFTATDQAQGDRAVYDIDQAVLVMTGHDLKLTTPTQVLTARDTLEYWAQKHMAVARGNAVGITSDARRIAADTLVAYTTAGDPASAGPKPVTASADPLGASGKLEKVEAFGHVSIRTAADTVTGDRGVYVPATGMARLGGKVRITRGQNQLNGAQAVVNMKTGVARLLAGKSGRVQGLVIPNDQTNQALTGPPPARTPDGGKTTP